MVDKQIAGKYKIKKILGEGAFGRVYQGLITSHFFRRRRICSKNRNINQEPTNAGQPLLQHEALIYKELLGISLLNKMESQRFITLEQKEIIIY